MGGNKHGVGGQECTSQRGGNGSSSHHRYLDGERLGADCRTHRVAQHGDRGRAGNGQSREYKCVVHRHVEEEPSGQGDNHPDG